MVSPDMGASTVDQIDPRIIAKKQDDQEDSCAESNGYPDAPVWHEDPPCEAGQCDDALSSTFSRLFGVGS